MVIVDQRDDGHLLSRRLHRFLLDEPIANQIADRFAARGIALVFVAAIEGLEQGVLQRNADACEVWHRELHRKSQAIQEPHHKPTQGKRQEKTVAEGGGSANDELVLVSTVLVA